jgi:ATP-dependent Lhr-like helicase
LALTATADLLADTQRSLNFPALAKRSFREIARVSGLIQGGMPYERKSMRHLQMSASLLFDVFQNYEPNHPLLRESFREVERTQLEFPRLARVCHEMAAGKIIFRNPAKLTPFAFPLFVARVSSRLSTETLASRIARLQKGYLEKGNVAKGSWVKEISPKHSLSKETLPKEILPE